VSHSLGALVWMNEPPHVDPRAACVVIGAIVALLAVLQAPALRQLPASLAVVTLAAMASALFVHTHNYPGRMSIHLVPLTSAATVLAGRAVGGAVLERLRRVGTPH
jgi:peptidoglycan/LPS O-acetylase OafA/YrhL